MKERIIEIRPSDRKGKKYVATIQTGGGNKCVYYTGIGARKNGNHEPQNFIRRIRKVFPNENVHFQNFVEYAGAINKCKYRKIHFGASDYEQFKDSTGVGKYSSKNHGDSKRRKSYFLRHSGVQFKKDAVKKEVKKSNGKYTAKILSHLFLW